MFEKGDGANDAEDGENRHNDVRARRAAAATTVTVVAATTTLLSCTIVIIAGRKCGYNSRSL